MIIDDGVNDYDAGFKAAEKLEAEGFFDEVRKKHGLSKPTSPPKPSDKFFSLSRANSGKGQSAKGLK
jgi:hypothetical protein